MISTKQIFKDHLGREIEIEFPPRRIVSLCPSQTETLVDLGLSEKIVGRTSFCIHPKEVVANIAVVGGTKTLKTERVLEMNPDLVIAEKEENTEEMINELQEEVPVYVTDVRDWFDGVSMIRDLGALTDTQARANQMADSIAQKFSAIEPLKHKKNVLYLIWENPWMAVGSDTYINSVLDLLGFRNLATRLTGRYPKLTTGQMRQLNPEIIFLSTEPFQFKEEHVTKMQEEIPDSKIILVDGEMFTWYGSRMLKAPTYFNEVVEMV